MNRPAGRSRRLPGISPVAVLLVAIGLLFSACSAAPQVFDFRATPTLVAPGESVFLTWVTRDADEVTLGPGYGVVEPVGFLEVIPPTGTTTYTVTARSGSKTASASVVVEAVETEEEPAEPAATSAIEPAEAAMEAELIADTFGAPATVEYDAEVRPWVKQSGERAILVNRPTASNPSYFQLKLFIETDLTDQHAFLPGEYTGLDFAEALHNSAERYGHRAGVAIVTMAGGWYALNVFNTTDAGIVFVDCAVQTPEEQPCDTDTVAYVRYGEPVGLIQVSYADSPAYSFYKEHNVETDRFKALADDFDRLYEEFEELLAGRTEVPEPDYSRLRAMETELHYLAAEIQSITLATGVCHSEDMGNPEALFVWW